MPALPKAPLVYTLAVVRFPHIPDVMRFRDRFHDLVRSEYPNRDDLPAQVFHAEISADGNFQVEQRQVELFQFSTPDRKWAFIFGHEVFGLHTNSYLDRSDFFRRLEFGLKSIQQVKELELKWVDGLGIRYVDLIEPRPGETVEAYIKPWLLPVAPPADLEGVTLNDGIYISRFATDLGSLRVQVLRDPPGTLPPEIDTPLAQKNHWRRARPAGPFLLIDTDHGRDFEEAIEFDVQTLMTHLSWVHEPLGKMFRAFSTEFAMNVWERNDESR
jgi:uncharacterized protein (TIGR04255 family)